MRRPVLSQKRLSSSLPLGFLLIAASGCYSATEGKPIPDEIIYFPVGLAVSGDGQSLIIANSDFDLQYSTGTLGVLDLNRIDALLDAPRNPVDSANPCGAFPLRPVNEQLVYPGRCAAIDPRTPPDGVSLYTDHVRIGAFATDVVYRTMVPSGIGRVFAPVRGDATLHWADIEAGRLDCGQVDNNDQCDDAHRAGNNAAQENTRDLRLGAEPYGLDVSPTGSSILVTNQTTGKVSLFLHSPKDAYSNGLKEPPDINYKEGPRLQFEVTNLPSRPVGVAALPIPALAWALLPGAETPVSSVYSDGFLVTYRNAPQIDLIRVLLDEPGVPRRPYASRANSADVRTNSISTDSRDIAIDDSARRKAELACLAQQGLPSSCASRFCDEATPEQREALQACLRVADTTQVDVFVANRTPASLLVGRMIPAVNNFFSSEIPAFYDSIPLSSGPARVVVGEVTLPDSTPERPLRETRVFVSCFDSRQVYIYDPRRRQVEATVSTGRGPHALAVDAERGYLFVGHFTDSYIGVVNLNQRYPRTYAKMIAGIGIPTAPRASK